MPGPCPPVDVDAWRAAGLERDQAERAATLPAEDAAELWRLVRRCQRRQWRASGWTRRAANGRQRTSTNVNGRRSKGTIRRVDRR